jgi:hypothetical protein
VSERAERLRKYLARFDGAPMQRADECCGFVAGWITSETGAYVRWPRYDSALAVARLLARGGGLVAMADLEMGRIGLSRTAAPALGDVGAVELAAGPTVVIFAAGGIAYLRNAGGGVVGFKPGAIAAAWAL